jgi:methylmalonyl-CoA carboxyltransferase large subunit
MDWARLADAVEALRKEMARLSERVVALEAATGALGRAATWVSKPVPAPESLSEELVVVIGAAIAAFLGKRAHIRQIRLLDSPAWAQQGRVTMQAAHTLSHAH